MDTMCEKTKIVYQFVFFLTLEDPDAQLADNIKRPFQLLDHNIKK